MNLALLLTGILFLFSIAHFKPSIYFTSAVLICQYHLASGIRGVKLLYLICLFQILLFYFRQYNRRWQSSDKYPAYVAIACLLASVGYVLSNLFGVSKNYATTIVNCACYFVYPYVFFRSIEDKEDLQLFLKMLLIFFAFVAGYALVELITGINYYSLFINDHGLAEGILGGENLHERFGFRRCNSLLPYSSALGMTSAITFFILMFMRVRGISIHPKAEMALLILLPFCVLISGTRSQMINFVICLFPFVLWNQAYKTKAFKVLAVLFTIAAIALSSNLEMIYQSIVNADDAEMGSTVEMRQEQWDICYEAAQESPVFGLGKNYIWEYVRPKNPALHGAESVWFQLVVDYGFVGCATYLLVVLACVLWLARANKRLAFMPIAFLVGKSLSIVIGIELSYLLISCIVVYKIAIFYSEDEDDQYETEEK